MRFDLLAWISLAIVVCNLYMLATSRLSGMIRGVAAQGLLLSILPLLLPHPAARIHMILLVFLGMAIKGILIPRYLFRAIRDVRVVREVNPSVGYSLSVSYGILTSAFAFYVLRKIPFYSITVSPFHASTAIATAFIGIFLIVARRNVVSQIIGYLVFENSALSSASRSPPSSRCSSKWGYCSTCWSASSSWSWRFIISTASTTPSASIPWRG